MMNWISVKDRLPVFTPRYDDSLYLVYDAECKLIRIAYFGYWQGEYCFVGWTGITHWMPLPKPPKGE